MEPLMKHDFFSDGVTTAIQTNIYFTNVLTVLTIFSLWLKVYSFIGIFQYTLIYLTFPLGHGYIPYTIISVKVLFRCNSKICVKFVPVRTSGLRFVYFFTPVIFHLFDLWGIKFLFCRNIATRKTLERLFGNYLSNIFDTEYVILELLYN